MPAPASLAALAPRSEDLGGKRRAYCTAQTTHRREAMHRQIKISECHKKTDGLRTYTVYTHDFTM